MFGRVFSLALGSVVAAAACTYAFTPGPPPTVDAEGGIVDAGSGGGDAGGACAAFASAKTSAAACGAGATCTDSYNEPAGDECGCPISVNRTQTGAYEAARSAYDSAGCKPASCPPCPLANGVSFGSCRGGACALE